MTADNAQYGTSGGNRAKDDKVCVSAEIGVNKYYPTDEKRVVKPTPYAKAKGAICDPYSGTCYRWIRNPGVNQKHACVVDLLGGINTYGEPVFADFIGVRPVIWIKL